MTRPTADVEAVRRLLCEGVSQAETARRTGVPRSTVRTWIRNGIDERVASTPASHTGVCEHVANAPGAAYAYLLGLYLGDGCLSAHARGVYRLRIKLDERYPGIIAEGATAMAEVLPNKVGITQCLGCLEVSAYSKHWPCLFPQHAPGPKHLRPIVLEPWQEAFALDAHPRRFLRGLIHSDGCRGTNPILGGRYAYPRYLFSNRSPDIQALFVEACQRVGIAARPSNQWNISVARRDDVALMDTFVGAKS